MVLNPKGGGGRGDGKQSLLCMVRYKELYRWFSVVVETIIAQHKPTAFPIFHPTALFRQPSLFRW